MGCDVKEQPGVPSSLWSRLPFIFRDFHCSFVSRDLNYTGAYSQDYWKGAVEGKSRLCVSVCISVTLSRSDVARNLDSERPHCKIACFFQRGTALKSATVKHLHFVLAIRDRHTWLQKDLIGSSLSFSQFGLTLRKDHMSMLNM